MAHFAKIENEIVTQIIVVADSDCNGGNFPESELAGQQFITQLGLDGDWKQTSYNNKFRKQYAGIGYTFKDDNFIPPCPYDSWKLDENYDWQPPIDRPEEDGELYYWDETNLKWSTMEEKIIGEPKEEIIL